MAFAPLPKILTDHLRRLSPDGARSIELGCGDGRLQAVVRDEGCDVPGLDRTPPVLGSAASIVGMAERPPLVPGSLDLVLAGNLLRHVLVHHSLSSILTTWMELLRPGGMLMVLEDHPRGGKLPEKHYRRLQTFLTRLMPDTRGPLLDPEMVRRRSADLNLGGVWTWGDGINRYPLDAGTVIGFLEQGQGDVPGVVGGLIDAIRSDGIATGKYWWCAAVKHASVEPS